MPSLPDRPEVLTEDKQQRILELLRGGNYLTTACNAAGLTSHAFDYWRRLYESGAEHAQKYADFFTAVNVALSQAESDSLALIRKGEPGWQGAAWFLGRRFPKRWSKQREESKGQQASNPTVDAIRAEIESSPTDDQEDR